LVAEPTCHHSAHIVGNDSAIRDLDEILVETCVPHHPFPAVPDEIDVVAEYGGLTDVDSRRPLRDVGDVGLTAVENEDTVGELRRLRCRR
jgi:hypothetical protein